MVPASLQGRYVIRFTVTSHNTRDEDVDRDWKVIRTAEGRILAEAETAAVAEDLQGGRRFRQRLVGLYRNVQDPQKYVVTNSNTGRRLRTLSTPTLATP